MRMARILYRDEVLYLRIYIHIIYMENEYTVRDNSTIPLFSSEKDKRQTSMHVIGRGNWLNAFFIHLTLSTKPSPKHKSVNHIVETKLQYKHCSNCMGHDPQFNIKIPSYQYSKSHSGDKMILRLSYLHSGISYPGEMVSLYWIRALVVPELLGLHFNIISLLFLIKVILRFLPHPDSIHLLLNHFYSAQCLPSQHLTFLLHVSLWAITSCQVIG